MLKKFKTHNAHVILTDEEVRLETLDMIYIYRPADKSRLLEIYYDSVRIARLL
ncbi:hypothetical protein [Enterococcus diestrammenae]|uniref:Uncharacterized protein n=1 Tax=Enterococcus diestrammenae TaxID=1155073 RepID=A0ABV0F2Q5_9ENTE|nr:hypothetical protein [Enterococcus diestrammenae]